MSNIKIVKKKEANKYFKRNLDFFNSTKSDYRILDLLKTSNIKPKSILEIGCANGIKLNEYQKNLNSKINYGIDLSSEAIKSGKKKFKKLKLIKLPSLEIEKIKIKFDLIICGFFLYLLDREEIMSREAIRKTVAEALELVDLGGTENKKPAELSGGMRKRVGLARAIIYKPEIIVYDEPTTGLDPVVSDSIDQLVIKMRDQLNCTTIVVTHDTRSMRRVGNHVMMLHHGLIHANGKPDEIFKSTDPIVHKFVNGIADPKDLEF